MAHSKHARRGTDTEPPGPILFDPARPEPPHTLDGVVCEALGAASVCWENPAGAGVFIAERALAIAAEVVAWVEQHYVRRSVVGLAEGD